MMGLGKRQHWLEIADGLFIHMRESGVLEQYEGMIDRDDQTTTLMSYFPYGYANGSDSDAKTFEYYITNGMERYCYYPIISGFLGIFPA